MMSIFSKKADKPKKDKTPGSKLDRELPYVVTLITIMAASGISPFGSFTKLARYQLLPNIMKEARKIVNRVHVLGDDPLTAMEERANRTQSTQFRDLLMGYVATVRNGGDIASFLQSKMHSIFEYETAVARQSIAKIGGLVDAYMIMQVIALSLYVVVVALSSMPSSSLLPASMSSPVMSYFIVFVLLPAISMAIMYALDKTITSTLVGAADVLRQGVTMSVGAIASFALLSLTGISLPIKGEYLFPIFLVGASVWPAYKMLKTERNMRGMEAELPSYLRDIAESRKAGLSPEKCVIYASERLRKGEFQSVVKAFANQLEWGVPLRKIYANLSSAMRSYSALVHFRILIEAIESGGGYTTSLDILAKSSEATANTEKEKASMLKPYFIIAFMVTAMMSVTTLMVSQTFVEVGQNILPGAATTQQDSGVFAIGIAAQSWMTGFLMGKISTGSFAAGFRYAIMLVAISTFATVMTLELGITPSVFMPTSSLPGT
ncbi:type II secretion system F family protein [Candidatus Nitrososphaera sp. FF02]|uniref:type II secretion system F family protein n=1 Tax=Candidatus Nitrososphaera sp. FF02 TaxID=3398226 RepID=UPI0039E794E4